MIEPYLIHQIAFPFVNIIGLYIALWVLFSNRKNKSNQAFFKMTVCILLWTTFSFLFSSSNQPIQALFWVKLNFGAVSGFFITAYLFSLYFPQEGKRYPILDKIVISTGTLFFFLSIFTDLIIKNIETKEWGNNVVAGKAGNIFYTVIIFLTFLILFNIFKKYFYLNKEEKLKVQYFLIGIIIFALMNIVFNVIFPFFQENSRYYQLGDYSAIFFLGFTAFAIVKRELFGIKVLLTTILFGAMTILLATLPFFMPNNSLKILTGIALFFFIIFGFLLVKSTYAEVRRKEEAERLLKAKTEFLSIASHQLRTPLTAIIGYSSMLNEGDYGAIPETAGKAIARIYDSSQRMIKLVNDFLSVSRMETGKTTLKLQEVSINDLIREVISGLELRAKEKNLYLKYQEPTDYYLKVDPAKTKEVISNFIDNAIHYTEEGGITVSVQKNNLKTVISVSDTGAGMDPEELAKLFESFSRGSAGNELNTQGSGLGLYIAKKFVELHNGRVWAKSEGKGKGSTFFIELPNR